MVERVRNSKGRGRIEMNVFGNRRERDEMERRNG